jgi:hypothetical protein
MRFEKHLPVVDNDRFVVDHLASETRLSKQQIKERMQKG